MATSPPARRVYAPQALEWPSLVLTLLIYAGWVAATIYAQALPWWLMVPVGSWLIAWHMSLQHEVMHGHPTPRPWLNDLIGSVPLSLWLPYQRYKATHLGHHDGAELTDPIDDPESHYITPADYAACGRLERMLMRANNTLLGRLIIGPPRGIQTFLCRELKSLWQGDQDVRRAWLMHVPAVALVVLWLKLVCHLSLIRYAAFFIYPGFSLALIRSFAEHRTAEHPDHRTAVVEHAPVLGLLFLFNNLHVVHHLRPGLAWYRIPAAYRRDRAALLTLNGGLVYRNYRDVAWRYLLRQHDVLVRPGSREISP